jgi:hypothetical protein
MVSDTRQFGFELFPYMSGLGISNDLTNPDTVLNISAGLTVDSTNSYQLNSPLPLRIDTSITGVNGLDTGIVQISTVYGVYVVWDPVSDNGIGTLLSKSLTTPLLPIGFSAYKLIGYVATQAGSPILQMGSWTAGNTGARFFRYDVAIAVLSGGTSVTRATIDLTGAVPLINNIFTYVGMFFSSTAVGHFAFMYSLSNVGNADGAVISQVANVPLIVPFPVFSQITEIAGVLSPAIQYEIADAGTDTLGIFLAGYQFNV